MKTAAVQVNYLIDNKAGIILDAELAKPSISQIDLDLGAEPTLGTKCKYVAQDQHPDHEHRINQRPASVGVEWSELVVHPIRFRKPSICRTR